MSAATSAVYIPRLALLQARLGAQQAVLLTDPHDMQYFSGFLTLVPEEREGYLIVTKEKAFLLYSSFSPLPEPLEVKALVGTFPKQVHQHLEFIAKDTGINELLVDKTRIFVNEFEAITQELNLKIGTFDKKWVWELRQVKDQSEISAITAAAQVAARAYEKILPLVKVGVTERQLQLELEAALRELGCYQTAFPTIVAFGAHTALPHHQPSDLKLSDNMAVLMDFGATTSSYRSDMTRSFWFGDQPDSEYLKIKDVVDRAYQAVLDMYQQKVGGDSPATAADLDLAARDLITGAGFGEHFIHTTGHGVGLEIHEPPSISSQINQVLKTGTVVTIEPGIYLVNRFGYRYENTVLATDKELQPLTLP
jgi:Xaa-Pro aminopeptidase